MRWGSCAVAEPEGYCTNNYAKYLQRQANPEAFCGFCHYADGRHSKTCEGQFRKMEADLARVTAERDELREHASDQLRILGGGLQKAQAENARLRAALEVYRDRRHWSDGEPCGADDLEYQLEYAWNPWAGMPGQPWAVAETALAVPGEAERLFPDLTGSGRAHLEGTGT